METKNENMTYSTREMKQLINLAIKLAETKTRKKDDLNVIISGNVRKGVNWLEMVDEMLNLRLKGAPYQPLFKGKVFEGNRIFIVVSDLPDYEIKKGFRRDYIDTIRLSLP